MTLRRFALAFAVAAMAAAASAQTLAPSYGTPPIPDYVAKAVASPDRAEAMKARDGGRKPAEVFALSGIKPGDKVIEFGSFGYYDTTLISGIVGPKGHVFMYDLPYMQARTEESGKAFVDAHKNAEHKVAKFDEVVLPKGVDLVVFDMYYHDLKGKEVDTLKLDKQVYAALKPGGRVLVVDHRAEPGSGWRDSTTIHRMDTATIVEAGRRLRPGGQQRPVREPGRRQVQAHLRADHPRRNGPVAVRFHQAEGLTALASKTGRA
jgi:predicted methyltransferase